MSCRQASSSAGECDLWAPLSLDPNRANRDYYFLSALARLKPNVAIEQARTEMDTIARQLALEYPKTNKGWGVKVVRLSDELVGNARIAILVLSAAVAFVLLIACANVANLLLVRAAGRQKEFAIRAALGAGRFDIVRRLVGESILLSLAGGAVGVLLAHWGIAALIALHPENIPRLEEVSIDSRVLAFTIAVSLVTGVLFGLLAAWQFSRLDVNDALKESGRGASDSRSGRRTRSSLVVAEVALALVLLIGAGLDASHLRRARERRSGIPNRESPHHDHHHRRGKLPQRAADGRRIHARGGEIESHARCAFRRGSDQYSGGRMESGPRVHNRGTRAEIIR